MRTLSTSIFITLLLTVAAMVATAQTPAAIKVGYINSNAFYDEKVGIAKIIAVNTKLDAEFGAKLKQLQDGNTRLGAIAKELETMQKLPANAFNQAAFDKKRDEGSSLERELQFNKTEVETAISKRRAELMQPVSEDVGKAIDDFAKKNGFGIIMDVGKLYDAGALLYFAEASDATKDFITFYNARGTAAPATPK